MAYVDLLTTKTTDFLPMTNSTIWWSFTKQTEKQDKKNMTSCRARYLQNWRFFKYIGQSILLFCLFVCQSPTGHNFKLIFTKLHHLVGIVMRKKTVVVEVKRSKDQHRPKVNKFVEFLKSSIFIRLTRNLNRICISASWIQPLIIF